MARRLDLIELGVTLILLIEILFRLVCQWRGFYKSSQNLVDAILVVVTLVIQIPGIHNSGKVYDWFTIFQIIRVYRVVWAVPVTRVLLVSESYRLDTWLNTYNAQDRVLGNVSGLLNLLFFVILLTYLCAIFAVQLVRGDIPAEDGGEPIRVPFNTMYNSFLGMYQVFSSENWTDILYNATQFQKPYNVGWISAMFFVGWFILSNFVVLNMFIAVIQENFDVSEDDKRMHQIKAFLARKDLGRAVK